MCCFLISCRISARTGIPTVLALHILDNLLLVIEVLLKLVNGLYLADYDLQHHLLIVRLYYSRSLLSLKPFLDDYSRLWRSFFVFAMILQLPWSCCLMAPDFFSTGAEKALLVCTDLSACYRKTQWACDTSQKFELLHITANDFRYHDMLTVSPGIMKNVVVGQLSFHPSWFSMWSLIALQWERTFYSSANGSLQEAQAIS